MPIHYGSQVDEHHAVRTKCGMFDVSHMLTVDVSDADAVDLLRLVLVGDVARLGSVGDSLYTLMLNDDGGVIDDLIVYRMSDGFRIVFNASMANTDIEWLSKHSSSLTARVSIQPRRDLGMMAVQGPLAIRNVASTLNDPLIESMRSFTCRLSGDCFVARTGYTGEDGVEIIAKHDRIVELWYELLGRGVIPCGLGARDTLRIEAGLNLNGSDMDQSITPFECALRWTIHWEPDERRFIGRDVLTRMRAEPPSEKLTGIVLEESGVLRHGIEVETSEGTGIITSGTFSPTLGYGIGFARVPRTAKGSCNVKIRGRTKAARLVKPPFAKYGKKVHA